MRHADRLARLAFWLFALAAIGLLIWLWLSAPALTAENCDLRIFAGKFLICR